MKKAHFVPGTFFNFLKYFEILYHLNMRNILSDKKFSGMEIYFYHGI